jgi:hypothetical protein
MNIEEIKKDLQALCEKHNVMIYADEDNAATVIEQLLTMEEADGGCPPERFSFDFATFEQVREF